MTHFHRYLTIILVAVGAVMAARSYGDVITMDRFVYEDDGEGLSRRDSLIQEMVCFINPENKLSKSMRKAVETRINGFPHKVIRRDTTTYFINAAYAVSYNEFRKHNYKAAKKWVDRFKKYGMPPSFWSSTFGYSSVGLNASSSINAKGGFKAKKRKNVWGLRFSFPKFNSQKFDSIKFDPKRTETKFIEDFIRDLPTDLAFSTYKKLLIYYKDREGILTYLNGFGSPSFVQRCVENGREDIFLLVCDIWNADPDDFKTNEWGYFGYYPDKEKKETANIFSFDSRYSDIDYKKAEIDSTISSNHRSKLGNKITWLLNLYYNRSCYSDILNACQTYKFNIEEAFFPRFNNYWGLALAKLGRYEEALPYFDLAFLYSSNEEYRNVYKINKAYSLGESGRTKEAAQLLMSERNNLKDSYSKFCWYDNLGYVYSRQDPDKSLTYYEEADKYLDKWSIYTDLIVRHLCREAAEQNDMYIKRSFIDEAVRIGDTRVIRDRNVTGMAQTELGVLGMMAFDYDKADRCFIKADSLLRNLSAEDARRSYLNNNRAINLVYQGRYGEAIEILKKQLTLQAKVYDSRHPEYVHTVRNLLRVSCKSPVEELTTDSLYSLWQKVRRIDRRPMSVYENLLAEIDYSLYRHEWRRVVELIEAALSSNFNSMQRLELSSLYEKICRDNFPEEYCSRVGKIIPLVKKETVNSSLLLPSGDRKVLHKPISDIVSGLIEVGQFKEALDLLIFKKGMLFNTRQSVEKKLSSLRKTKGSYQELLERRKSLNDAIAYNDSAHIPEIVASISRLERELYHKLRAEKEILNTACHSIDQPSSLLSSDDIAVEFVKYEKNGKEHYGAFIIDADGLDRFVEIGDRKEIIDNPGIVWDFLKNRDEKTDNIYFSADGILHNIGIEYYYPRIISAWSQKFHRLFHLANIKSSKANEHIRDKVAIVGVSDHNSPVGESKDSFRGSWTDLLNVETEIDGIVENLGNHNLTILYNDAATEPTMKSLSGNDISTLHITTHGFYRNHEKLEQALTDPSNDDYHIARRFLKAGIEDLSGLVLRQGNLSWKSPEILDEEDDLLTAEEIELMSFPNLQLTVLSACDTGLGATDSEGVWGLQRAFRIAGTKNLVCSLSEVNDYWSAQFMDLFYEQLGNGAAIYDAFHHAQKTLREENPDNPEIWASFILIE